jgi:hypothetical protein
VLTNFFQAACVTKHTAESKNATVTALKKMGRPDKMIVLNVLIIVMLLVCDSIVTL